jgi:hypothetical protein
VAPDFDSLVGILEPYDGQDLEERDWEIQQRRNPDEAKEALPGMLNGLVVPAAFQAFLQRFPDRDWRLKAIPSVYECQDWRFTPYDTVQLIVSGTAWVAAMGILPSDPKRYPPESHGGIKAKWEDDRPDYLPGVTDYSQILAFGVTPSPEGLIFAFDYRENLQEPSVICCRPKSEIRWRRIAPNFETFLHLFEGYEEEEEKQ